MTTDDRLIEHLRSSMHDAADDLFPPAGLLAGIAVRHRRRPTLPSFGILAVGFGTAVTLAVAVLAVVLLSHPAASVTRPATRGVEAQASASTLSELRSELGILRRPQRAADRLSHTGVVLEQRMSCGNCLNVARLIPGETRLLATIHAPRLRGAQRIYLALGTVPARWGRGEVSGWRQRGRAIQGLHLTLFGRIGTRSIDELLNYTGAPAPAQTLTPSDVFIGSYATVGVVPDGVTRVKWELANPGQKTPAIVYPRVHGNVAQASWTSAPRSTSLINEQWLVGATWYGRDGRVIARFSQSLAGLDR